MSHLRLKLPIVTLNVNGPNLAIKRLADWIKNIIQLYVV